MQTNNNRNSQPSLPNYSFQLPFPQGLVHPSARQDCFSSWMPWQIFAWHQMMQKVQEMPLSTCKIEEPPQVFYPQTQLTEPKISNVKEEQHTSKEANDNGESELALAQRRALNLIKHQALSPDQITYLLKYRMSRIENYIFKKTKRNYQKKVVYDTRKQVADKRIRYKGKFINEEQARNLLGLNNQDHTFQQLKKLMREKQREQ